MDQTDRNSLREDELISVIVAIYNIEDYLVRCLDSILAQTYRNLEILLVDDGSTDSCGRICDAYARKDPRIRVIHKQNGGLSDARNAGLEVAAGTYIGFVDGDDWIEPDMYRAMYEACKRHGAQMASCRYRQITKEGTIDGSTDLSVSLSKTEALELYVCGHERYLLYHSVWSKLFARELIIEQRFPVGRNSEDIMFTTRAFCRMERLVYLDRAYYNYVLDRDGSIMNEKVGERRLKDELPFWREQIAYLHACRLTEIADKAAYYFYRRLLFYYVDFMGEKETRPYAEEILRQVWREKKEICRLLGKEWAVTGDKVRLRFLLYAPRLYYRTVLLYDRYVIPLRLKLRKG